MKMVKIGIMSVFLSFGLHADYSLPVDTISSLSTQVKEICNNGKNKYMCFSDNIGTICEFEFLVYRLWKRMRPDQWDGFDSYLRLLGYVKNFLIFLENFGSQLKDHDQLVYDTDAFKWSQYRTTTGNYDFKSGDEKEFDRIISDIIDGIVKAHQ